MKLAKTYQPGEYEADIYDLWEKSGAFRPSGEGEAYSLVIPPPNANGDLHLGHGLTLAVEDILIRYHRQKGRDVLFVPGADHAGFETQVVYEKELAKQGKSRFDFSREKLYQQIWDFVQQNRSNFETQIRRLGT
ncbi:MAG TPA: class I tRNA ligase family protein, partial [Candidatus Saccharimonadales bacterium]|nr:class I tRNA ligase family protein [Candidatus Saccharimonadales bacterium]